MVRVVDARTNAGIVVEEIRAVAAVLEASRFRFLRFDSVILSESKDLQARKQILRSLRMTVRRESQDGP